MPPSKLFLDLVQTSNAPIPCDLSNHTVANLDLHVQTLQATFNVLEAELQTYISQKNSERNSLLPISRLPNELVEIFRQCANPCRNKFCGRLDETSRYYLSLLDLMLVSKQWANLVKAAPPLWSYLSIRLPPSLIDQANRLSGSHVVDLDFRHLPRNRPNTTSYSRGRMDQMIPRTRQAILQFTQQDMQWLDKLFASPAPYLEDLQIDFTEQIYYVAEHLIPFLQQIPKLQILKLTGVTLRWDAPFLVNLRCLSLDNIHSNRRPTLSQLLSILRNCPNIQRLSLKNIDIISDSILCQPFQLPSLTFLELKEVPAQTLSQILLVTPLVLQYFDLEVSTDMADSPDEVDEVLASIRELLGIHQHVFKDCTPSIYIEDDGRHERMEITFDNGPLFGRIAVNTVISALNILQPSLGHIPLSLELDISSWSAFRYERFLEDFNVTCLTLSAIDRCCSFRELLSLLARPLPTAGGVMRWHWENLTSIICRSWDISLHQLGGMAEERYGDEYSFSRRAGDYLDIRRPLPMHITLDGPRYDGEILNKIRAWLGPNGVEVARRSRPYRPYNGHSAPSTPDSFTNGDHADNLW